MIQQELSIGIKIVFVLQIPVQHVGALLDPPLISSHVAARQIPLPLAARVVKVVNRTQMAVGFKQAVHVGVV